MYPSEVDAFRKQNNQLFINVAQICYMQVDALLLYNYFFLFIILNKCYIYFQANVAHAFVVYCNVSDKTDRISVCAEHIHVYKVYIHIQQRHIFFVKCTYKCKRFIHFLLRKYLINACLIMYIYVQVLQRLLRTLYLLKQCRYMEKCFSIM